MPNPNQIVDRLQDIADGTERPEPFLEYLNQIIAKIGPQGKIGNAMVEEIAAEVVDLVAGSTIRQPDPDLISKLTEDEVKIPVHTKLDDGPIDGMVFDPDLGKFMR